MDYRVPVTNWFSKSQLETFYQWAQEIIVVGETMGRALDAEELRFAKDVGVNDVDAVRILEVYEFREFPKDIREIAEKTLNIKNSIGMTLGHLILIRKGHYSARLLRHELRHVHQVEEIEEIEKAKDLKPFFAAYIAQLMTFGYKDSPMEIDARNFEE